MNEFEAQELATSIGLHSSMLGTFAGRAMPGDGHDPSWRYVLVGLDDNTDLWLERPETKWVIRLSRITETKEVETTRTIDLELKDPSDLEDVALVVLEVARRFYLGGFGPVVAEDAPQRSEVLQRILERIRHSQP